MGKIKIDEVKDLMERNLPECWLPLEACLSTIGAAMLEDVDHCIGLIIVGEPGGRKSTTLELLGGDEPIFVVHDFTPASFVSHDATKTEEQLKRIDLLPQLQYRILVVPELAPMFNKRHEDLVHEIGILTAVMDGKGYTSVSGTHGRRGYEGDYRFNMIAATTPLEHKAWQALGKLSSRWIFYRLGEAKGEHIDLTQDFASKKALCQNVVQGFIRDFWKGFLCISWDRAKDSVSLLTMLSWSAELMSRWRGLVVRQDVAGYNPPVIEFPARLAETLYALARGHALLWGRQQLVWQDAIFAVEVNHTNMPEDRARLFREFNRAGMEHMSEFTTFIDMFQVGISLRRAAKAIGCSEDRAKRVLQDLMDLGVVGYKKGKGYHRKL